MRITPDEIEKLTAKYYPDSALKALLECVFVAHKLGREMCRREFPDSPERDNVQSFCVRGKLEGLLRPTAERQGLIAKPIKHPGQRWYHTEVYSGPMIMTAATVETPGAMVDPADYRIGLAESNQGQLDLFSSNDGVGLSIYFLLTHSRSRWPSNGDLPGSVYLVYPAADLKQYIHMINLIDRFPDIVRKYVPEEWDGEAVVKYRQQTSKSGFQCA